MSKIILVDFKPMPGALTPDMTVKKRTYNDCKHSRVTICEAQRIVECKDCKAVLDPIDTMIGWAQDWERYADSVKYLMAEERHRRNELATLLRRIRNGRAQLRRMIAKGADEKMPPHNDAPDLDYSAGGRWEITPQ